MGGVGQVVVITGGSSGIGRCTALLFARRGWRVGLIARGEDALNASRRAIEAAGSKAATVAADVTDGVALANAADAISGDLGPIDVWINCAGNGVYGRFGEVPEAEFRRVTDVTYLGTVNGTRTALAQMRPRRQGRIVNVCSAVAFHGLPLMSSYAGAKAAVRAFSQALQAELRFERSPIRVTTVFPPAVNTPYFSHATSYMGWPARPVGPVYQPEIVAEGIWQAVHDNRPEIVISGTAAVFAVACRIAPSLIAWCMARVGQERQLTRDQDVGLLQEPTLFVPSKRVFGVHGPFGRQARTWSTQVWLMRLSRPAMFRSAWWRPARPPEILSLPTPVSPEPDQALEGLAVRHGAS